MTKKHTIIKNSLVVLLLLVAFFTVNFLTMLYEPKLDNVVAYSPTAITMADPNFMKPKSSVFPKTPDGFTKSTEDINHNITTGVINVSSGVYNANKAKYNLNDTELPPQNGNTDNTSDYNVLMINSKDAANSYGYNSEELKLAANAYYKISVDIYSNSNGYASVYLTSSNKMFDSAKIENIITGGWDTYTFYVSTSDYEACTVKLGLFLGKNNATASRGIVFFDNIVAQRVSNVMLNDEVSSKQNISATDYKYINMNNNVISKATFSPDNSGIFSLDHKLSSNVNNSLYTATGTYNITGKEVNMGGETFSSPKTDLSQGSQYAIGILNKRPTKTVYSNATPYEIEANRIYKFTIYAKISDLKSGSASFIITEVNKDGTPIEETDDIKALSTPLNFSTTSSAVDNNYQPFDIYVKGSPFSSNYVSIKFGLGVEKAAQGRMFFSRYSISLASQTAYDTVTAGSAVGKLDFSSKYVTTSSVENAYFNLLNNDNTVYDGKMPNYLPSQPKGWVGSKTGATNIVNGVISTKAEDFATIDKTVYTGITNPGNPPGFGSPSASNYVLMMGNIVAGTQFYKSSEIAIATDSIHKYQFYINTKLTADSRNGATVSLVTTDGTVLNTIENIDTKGTWVMYTMYIKNLSKELKANLNIALGQNTHNATGYLYFDNVVKSTSADDTTLSAEFDAKKIELATSSKTTEKLIDLSTSTFTYSNNKNSSNLYDPLLYTANRVNGSADVKSGILDTLNYDSTVLPVNPLGDDRDVLVIGAFRETEYNLTGKLSYTFSSGSYYKVTFKVYTHNLGQEGEPMFDEENEQIKFGAKLSISGFKDSFTGIGFDPKDRGEWKTYIFYIAPTETTTSNFVFGLGTADALTTGHAFFAHPKIETISTEEDYNSIIASYGKELPENILNISKPASTTGDDNNNKGNTPPNLILISSLITGLAIIIAVLGAVMRKIKFKRRSTKKHSEYDREDTLVKQIYRKEAMDMRDERLTALKTEQSLILAERKTIEEQYKYLVSNIRALKLERNPANAKEITSLEKETTLGSKSLKKLGSELSKIELEIGNITTEQYIYDLSSYLFKQAQTDEYVKKIEEKQLPDTDNKTKK